jgi:hypothetical protein
MHVTSIRNQYRGINAHLHSLWQGQGGWGDFHARHIVHLADALSAELESLGYVARVEESVQIRRLDESSLSPRADVLIYDTQPERPPAATTPGTLTLPLLELVAEPLSDKPFRAVAVYPFNRADRPVAWIELLSPTNKGTTPDADAYRSKRMQLMVGGLVFVELDYLHESPPSFPTIRPYSARNGRQYRFDQPHPYRIALIDPRPRLELGRAHLESIDVDQPLPMMEIPLEGSDKVAFDFNAVYHKTLADGRLGRDVDYVQLPLNFDRYLPDDQARIARRMLATCAAASRGDDLEVGPFAVDETITLDEVQERLKALA